jgi:hypothetical protein
LTPHPPPTVSITSPTNGSNVIQGAIVTLSVNVTTDLTDASVDFLVNGQVALTSTHAPYQYAFTAPLTGNTPTLSARATDVAANVGTAQNVVLDLVPGPAGATAGHSEFGG